MNTFDLGNRLALTYAPDGRLVLAIEGERQTFAKTDVVGTDQLSGRDVTAHELVVGALISRQLELSTLAAVSRFLHGPVTADRIALAS